MSKLYFLYCLHESFFFFANFNFELFNERIESIEHFKGFFQLRQRFNPNFLANSNWKWNAIKMGQKPMYYLLLWCVFYKVLIVAHYFSQVSSKQMGLIVNWEMLKMSNSCWCQNGAEQLVLGFENSHWYWA